MRKRLFSLLSAVLLATLLTVTVQAFTANGKDYNHPIETYTTSVGFGKYRGFTLASEGHTANLLGGVVEISNTGYWYNGEEGIEVSRKYGLGYTTSGGNYAKVHLTQQQCDTGIHLIGFKGRYDSPYRGFSGALDIVTTGPGNGHDSDTSGILFMRSLPKNSVSASIEGLSASDQANARLMIQGTGLPNDDSYGKSKTYSKSGTTSVNEGSAVFGNYYVSVYIPNIQNYDVTYSVVYRRGDKYQDKNNTATTTAYTGSGNFSTKSYYVESGGQLRVTVTARKKGTVIVDLRRGAGVTESYDGKAFQLFTDDGKYQGIAQTNSSGYAYFYNQPYGDYVIRPEAVPFCYYDPAEVPVTLKSDSVTGVITLRRKLGTLKIQYNTEDDKSRLNVRFKITKPDGSTVYGNTDRNGVITLENTQVGEYKIVQESVPEDYEGYTGTHTATVYAASTTTATFYNPILYDFSVTVSAPAEADQGSENNLNVVFRNKGGKTAYNVTAMVEADGKTLFDDTITLQANGTLTKRYAIDTASVGRRKYTAQINQKRNKNERNFGDNLASAVVNVKAASDLTIEFISPNAAYREGMEVISTYRVKNAGEMNVVPDHNLRVDFKAQYMENGKAISISSQNSTQVIIPKQGDNLVFFRWTVPKGLYGKSVELIATINKDHAVPEKDYLNNTSTASRRISKINDSDTPDTKYENKMPAGFRYEDAPAATQNASTSWAVWEWSNNWFRKVTYGMRVSASSRIMPASNVPTDSYTDGKYQMGSGYGFTISSSPTIYSDGVNAMPSTRMYTAPQSMDAYYPEYNYSRIVGKYTLLDRISGTSAFAFKQGAYGRVHHTPLWWPNRDYSVQVMVSEIWTPAGMLWQYSNTNSIRIIGSVYDDWYIGRH